MRVYEAIVKALEGIGVDAAFGGAGENAAPLMLALKHSTKIRSVITRHEQAASFMAWLRHLLGPSRCMLCHRRARRLQFVLRYGGRHVGLLSRPRY